MRGAGPFTSPWPTRRRFPEPAAVRVRTSRSRSSRVHASSLSAGVSCVISPRLHRCRIRGGDVYEPHEPGEARSAASTRTSPISATEVQNPRRLARAGDELCVSGVSRYPIPRTGSCSVRWRSIDLRRWCSLFSRWRAMRDSAVYALNGGLSPGRSEPARVGHCSRPRITSAIIVVGRPGAFPEVRGFRCRAPRRFAPAPRGRTGGRGAVAARWGRVRPQRAGSTQIRRGC